MSSCNNCKSKVWTCKGCAKQVSVDEYRNYWKENVEEKIAIYCDCCDHNFVCRICYDNTPSTSKFNYWKHQFGRNHSVWDNVSKESDLSRTLQMLLPKECFVDQKK